LAAAAEDLAIPPLNDLAAAVAVFLEEVQMVAQAPPTEVNQMAPAASMAWEAVAAPVP
jgi:hypothetical protein